jgi:hypothetical protein
MDYDDYNKKILNKILNDDNKRPSMISCIKQLNLEIKSNKSCIKQDVKRLEDHYLKKDNLKSETIKMYLKSIISNEKEIIEYEKQIKDNFEEFLNTDDNVNDDYGDY